MVLSVTRVAAVTLLRKNAETYWASLTFSKWLTSQSSHNSKCMLNYWNSVTLDILNSKYILRIMSPKAGMSHCHNRHTEASIYSYWLLWHSKLAGFLFLEFGKNPFASVTNLSHLCSKSSVFSFLFYFDSLSSHANASDLGERETEDHRKRKQEKKRSVSNTCRASRGSHCKEFQKVLGNWKL